MTTNESPAPAWSASCRDCGVDITLHEACHICGSTWSVVVPPPGWFDLPTLEEIEAGLEYSRKNGHADIYRLLMGEKAVLEARDD